MSNETATNDSFEKDREALRAIQVVFQQAVKDNTMEIMHEHIHEDFSLVSFTDKSFESFDAFTKQWKISRDEMVGSGSFTTELNPETSLFEGDIAICKGNALNQLVDTKGKSFSYNSNWTIVFKKVEGQWKVLRAHNSLDPFSNPMLLSGVKDKVLKIGIAAFAIGAVLSFGLGQLF